MTLTPFVRSKCGRLIHIIGRPSKRWFCEEVMRFAKVESDHGRLFVTFQYRSLRCREHGGLKDTRENRRAAAGIVREIELEIASGKFDYRARFPTSRNLKRLGL
jgi:hypothetical protein